MLPAGPLMTEHRLIERIIPPLKRELEKIEKGGGTDPLFIEKVVDFFRTYADRCHHGKEEDVLFSALSRKKISDEHKKIMAELIADHVYARKLIGKLANAGKSYGEGSEDAIKDIEAVLKELAALYPAHIYMEDKEFFLQVMDYFSDEEKDRMLSEFWEFDRKLIHEKYEKIMTELGG